LNFSANTAGSRKNCKDRNITQTTKPNKTMQYQIEKGVTMPELKVLRRGKKPLRIALEQMEIGDSIAIDRDHVHRAHASAKQAGIKIAVRSMDDGTTRVWRVA
jgi:hypothetical protein